jgi:hypothetical protein
MVAPRACGIAGATTIIRHPHLAACFVAESHDIVTKVRAHVRNMLPEIADVLGHIEPFGLGEPQSDRKPI